MLPIIFRPRIPTEVLQILVKSGIPFDLPNTLSRDTERVPKILKCFTCAVPKPEPLAQHELMLFVEGLDHLVDQVSQRLGRCRQLTVSVLLCFQCLQNTLADLGDRLSSTVLNAQSGGGRSACSVQRRAPPQSASDVCGADRQPEFPCRGRAEHLCLAIRQHPSNDRRLMIGGDRRHVGSLLIGGPRLPSVLAPQAAKLEPPCSVS